MAIECVKFIDSLEFHRGVRVAKVLLGYYIFNFFGEEA